MHSTTYRKQCVANCGACALGLCRTTTESLVPNGATSTTEHHLRSLDLLSTLLLDSRQKHCHARRRQHAVAPPQHGGAGSLLLALKYALRAVRDAGRNPRLPAPPSSGAALEGALAALGSGASATAVASELAEKPACCALTLSALQAINSSIVAHTHAARRRSDQPGWCRILCTERDEGARLIARHLHYNKTVNARLVNWGVHDARSKPGGRVRRRCTMKYARLLSKTLAIVCLSTCDCIATMLHVMHGLHMQYETLFIAASPACDVWARPGSLFCMRDHCA